MDEDVGGSKRVTVTIPKEDIAVYKEIVREKRMNGERCSISDLVRGAVEKDVKRRIRNR